MQRRTYLIRSVRTRRTDIKQLPHNPGIYIVRVGGNGFGNGAPVYVGKAESIIRSRWNQRLNNYDEAESPTANSDAEMFADLASHLRRGSRVSIECRTVTLKEFRGDRPKMVRRIRHDEGTLIERFRKPRLNKRYEREAIDPWLKFVDGFWHWADRFFFLAGVGFCIALLLKFLGV